MAIRNPPVFFIVTLVSLAIGILLFVISFATEYWAVLHNRREQINLGLWEGTRCNPSCDHTGTYQEGWTYAGQAFVCLALIGVVIATILFLLWWCVDSCRRRNILIAAVVILFIVVLLLVIGIIILATNLNKHVFDISWSMGLSIAAAAFFLLAGIMAAMLLCR